MISGKSERLSVNLKSRSRQVVNQARRLAESQKRVNTILARRANQMASGEAEKKSGKSDKH
jgi:hypothetical protein